MPNLRRQSDHDPGAQDTPDNLPVAGPPATDTHAPQEQFQLDINPAGDIFGDYTNYGAGDFGMEDREDRDMDEPATGEGHLDSVAEMEEEDEIALSEAILAEDEQRLEPERPSRSPDNIDEEMDVPPSQDPLHLRSGLEAPLSRQPEIVKFSVGNAGAVYTKKTHIGNQRYGQSVTNSHGLNRYEPFSSKLDWEIARWAKTRGPGSNALTELLSIEGVSFFCGCTEQIGRLLFQMIRLSRALD